MGISFFCWIWSIHDDLDDIAKGSRHWDTNRPTNLSFLQSFKWFIPWVCLKIRQAISKIGTSCFGDYGNRSYSIRHMYVYPWENARFGCIIMDESVLLSRGPLPQGGDTPWATERRRRNRWGDPSNIFQSIFENKSSDPINQLTLIHLQFTIIHH